MHCMNTNAVICSGQRNMVEFRKQRRNSVIEAVYQLVMQHYVAAARVGFWKILDNAQV